MNHPAQITLYTAPDGEAAAAWINGVPYMAIRTDEGRAAVAFIHEATKPRLEDTLPRLVIRKDQRGIVVETANGPFYIEVER